MNEELFNNIKKLLDVGVSPDTIVKLGTGSPATIWRVKQVTDYQGYRDLIEDSHKKEQAKKVKATVVVAPEVEPEEIKEAPVEASANWDIVKDLFTIVQDQSDIIKRMDSSLTWLAEHAVIQSVTTKRRFF